MCTTCFLPAPRLIIPFFSPASSVFVLPLYWVLLVINRHAVLFSHIKNQKQVLNSQTPSRYHIIFLLPFGANLHERVVLLESQFLHLSDFQSTPPPKLLSSDHQLNLSSKSSYRTCQQHFTQLLTLASQKSFLHLSSSIQCSLVCLPNSKVVVLLPFLSFFFSQSLGMPQD